MPFQSLLVANRGEIAVRIIRAARNLGIRSIAVFSDADEGALWARLADEAHRIGPAPARESYLDISRLIAVAEACGAEAVHPGYGFLSESPEFASAVAEAGLVFVGPGPEAIGIMANKVAARTMAKEAGLPLLGGSDEPLARSDAALELAHAIGWPVAVKASFGGGGRGMRVASGPEHLATAIEQAQREAGAAFGKSEVFLEKYLDRARHVEIQVLGDRSGNVIHLGDRDCTTQRRHQKLIEEAPAPALDDGIRAAMAEAALRLCRRVGYEGAGTVEFLVDPATGDFFFLEMNTRLQVEHGVTELVTGIDLVEQQICIAQGKPLGLAQSDIAIRGHAIQARIAAEDPWTGFTPAAGRLGALRLPSGPWVRCDFGVEADGRIEKHYDSMFGKIQAWGTDREAARRHLIGALREFTVEGPPTTAPYLKLLLEQEAFITVGHDTRIVERDWQPERFEPPKSAAGPPAQEDNVSERHVAVPWGGRLIEVSVFGLAAAGAADTELPVTAARSRKRAGGSSGPELVAPMDSVVMAVAVETGQHVAQGEPILILEAMKMEVPLAAPYDCRVEALRVATGETVRSGMTLAVLRREEL